MVDPGSLIKVTERFQPRVEYEKVKDIVLYFSQNLMNIS